MLERRNRSGEIVNATMTEIFLVFAFIFLVIGALYNADVNEAQEEINRITGVEPPDVEGSSPRKPLAPQIAGLTEDLEKRLGHLEQERAALERERKGLLAERHVLEVRAVEAEKKRDELQERIDIMFPPYCEGYGSDAVYAQVRLLTGGRVAVEVVRPHPASSIEGRSVMTLGDFEDRFRGLFRAVKRMRCRLPVRVTDDPTLGKDEFKIALRTVERYFYAVGQLDSSA